MSEIIDSTGAPVRSAEELTGLKNITLAVYVLQALAFLWALPAIVGVVINYIKREDVRGTLYESHFEWQIRSFWWGLLWCVLGTLLIVAAGLGFVVLFVAWIWMIYRVVKGFIKLNEGKPVLPA